MIKILTFSTLFPNDQQPVHGIFVENRLRHLLSSGKVEARVVAPVPWFPLRQDCFGTYATYAKVCSAETRHGLDIIHPRYPLIPKVGMNWTPGFMYRALRPVIRKVIKDGYDFDLIDAHYFYPDGIAAAMLAREFKKPLTITARGTDLNLIPQFDKPRQMIKQAAEQASGLITVCAALAEPLVDLGIDRSKIHVLRNGVDLTAFQPQDREQARQKLGLTGPTAVSVGGLIERKGHHIAIAAMTGLPELTLLIAGAGPERRNLENLAQEKGVADRVRFLGNVPHRDLPEIYSAADLMLLCSSREGWANVLLESMACGTPVVATDIWGTGEVVTCADAGVLMEDRTPEAVVKGINSLLSALPTRTATRRYAEGFSWDDTTEGQLNLFESILHGH